MNKFYIALAPSYTRLVIAVMGSLFLLAVVFSCQSVQAAAEGQQRAMTNAPSTAGQLLSQLFVDFTEERKKLSPISATYLGDKRYNHLLDDDLSAASEARFRALHANSLDKLLAIDFASLTPVEQDSYRIFRYQREMALEYYDAGFARLERLLPLNQFFNLPNTLATMGSGEGIQPFVTVKDYEAWIQRASQFSSWVDQAIVNMRDGMQAGIVQPKVLMVQVLPQLQTLLASSVADSIFYQPVTRFPDDFSAHERQRLQQEFSVLISESLWPAYQRLHDFIRDEYLPKCRDSVGLSALPGGANWYQYRLRSITTTDLTPEQIHAIGQQEVNVWFAEMKKLQLRMQVDGDIQDFFHYLRTDARFYARSEDALIESYRQVQQRIEPQLPRLFKTVPSTPFVIKPIEAFRAQSSAAAMYNGPALDGSRPGVFYVNSFDLPSRPTYMRDALFIHEAAPGHHFQVALAQERQDLPIFRRTGGNTAYVEGWGLYAESLGKVLGLYADDSQYLGYVYMNLWRANRLVVDTGLHALGWSRQQAIDWMTNYSPMPALDVIAEVERYIAIPGQAVAYKIGQRHILMLRERAEQALGKQFDVREFHHQIIGEGAFPLPMLEQKIDRWIDAVKRQQSVQ